MLNKKSTVLMGNLLLISILFLIFAPEYTLLHYINALFYITIFYLILFLVMYTIKGGFFDGVTFGFRRFNHVMFNRNDHLEEWRDKPLPSERIGVGLYPIIKVQTIGLILLLSILLIVWFI
ncbi:protein of unknown function [Mesobacillus persicus]|uniref:DUF3899 domain-containing protein n=1 Tax=Mesobacillus persicus TaxID=930146 RepID=A0A1H8GIP8_9BACI|nr:DUF3899 domain-containing protein [Mesobacillus persicus]SEN43872.1 protein of unknown function [Mesobacillus persicus]